MSYIPTPAISTKIGNKEKRPHPRHFMPRFKKVTIEPVVKEEKEALDNKFRYGYLGKLFDLRTPNYSKEEIRNVLENR